MNFLNTGLNSKGNKRTRANKFFLYVFARETKSNIRISKNLDFTKFIRIIQTYTYYVRIQTLDFILSPIYKKILQEFSQSYQPFFQNLNMKVTECRTFFNGFRFHVRCLTSQFGIGQFGQSDIFLCIYLKFRKFIFKFFKILT